MITSEKLDEWRKRASATSNDIWTLQKLQTEILLELSEYSVGKVRTSLNRVKAFRWFEDLLNDIETWDQAPMQSVLNDFGVMKSMANELIEYWESLKK